MKREEMRTRIIELIEAAADNPWWTPGRQADVILALAWPEERRFRGHDHPTAHGRTSEPGELEWTFSFELEDATTLYVSVGKAGREAFVHMLAEEVADDAIDRALRHDSGGHGT